MTESRDTKSRLGVSVSDHYFSSKDWLFREQPIHDWGIDAHVEPKSGGRPTGQLLALQIKTGPSYFTSSSSEGVRHAINDWHLEYWLRHQLPVFIILHEPNTAVTIWQKVDRHLVKRSKEGKWHIQIPWTNKLDDKAISFFQNGLAGDLTSLKRNQLALDYPLMLAVDGADSAFLSVVEMNHKGLSMRGASFKLDKAGKAEPDIQVERWHPERGIHAYMARMFPWLEYSHVQPLVDRSGSIEGEVHELRIELNAVGRAFVVLEDFYSNGLAPKSYELPFDDEVDDEAEDEEAFRRAVEND